MTIEEEMEEIGEIEDIEIMSTDLNAVYLFIGSVTISFNIIKVFLIINLHS
jgi:hypothetical protein